MKKRGGSIGKPLSQRFESHVVMGNTPNDCWQWRGRPDKDGYGKIYDASRGKKLRAHRVSYEIHVGPIPEGQWVLHACDNPPCTNPLHLFLGDNILNTADKMAKGRHSVLRGEDTSWKKLQESDVRQIYNQVISGVPVRTVANNFGVGKDNVFAIMKGRSWKHLGLTPWRSGRKTVNTSEV